MKPLLLAAPLLLFASPLASAQVTFTIMGSGTAADVSSDGNAVVGRDNQGAFLWTAAGGYQALGQDDAVAVSDDGTVVFGNMTDSNGDSYAGRWTAATGWVPVGALLGQSGTSVSSGYGMSNDGDTATGLGWNNAGDGAAFHWSAAAGTVALPQLGSNSHRGNVVSGDGNFVGGWDEGVSGPRQAALWDASFLESLILLDPVVNPDGLGEVFGLSTDGTWATGTGSPNGGPAQAYLWSAATGAQYLGTGPPTGGFFDAGFGNGVNDAGTIVVGQWGSGPFSFTGTIWTPSGGLEVFNTFLVNNGVSTTFGVSALTAITPDGSVVVGNAAPAGSFASQWFIATIDASIGTQACSPAVANSSGNSGAITATGSLMAADNSLILTATDLPTNQFGYFLNSPDQAFVPMAGGSQGTLCLGGMIGRHTGSVGSSGATGTLTLNVDLTALPRPMGTAAVMSGETWYFQCWFRDVNPMATSNFTDAVCLDFL